MAGGRAVIAIEYSSKISDNFYMKRDYEGRIREAKTMRELHEILREVSEAEITLKNKLILNDLIKEKYKSL